MGGRLTKILALMVHHFGITPLLLAREGTSSIYPPMMMLSLGWNDPIPTKGTHRWATHQTRVIPHLRQSLTASYLGSWGLGHRLF